MKREIVITLADMQTGNYERAMLRFDKRVNSIDLSRVIRALLSVMRGDDTIQYLQNLQHEYEEKAISNLRLEAEKKPEKIDKYTMILFLCFIAIIMTGMILYMISLLKEIF